jgi:hypothetical protein
MRAQGLPLNFIILGALALLVLVVVVAFFITGAGGFGAAISAQAAQTECTNRCNGITQAMSLKTTITASGAYNDGNFTGVADNFCLAKFNIRGQGDKYCDQIKTCVVTFADQTSCQVSCFGDEDTDAGISEDDAHTVSDC